MSRCSARLLYAPQKVTPSPSKSAGLPEAKTTPGVQTRWRIGVPGAWHSQQSYPPQSVNPTRILTVSGFGGTANLKSPTLSKPEVCDVRESSIRLTQDSSAFTRRRMSTWRSSPSAIYWGISSGRAGRFVVISLTNTILPNTINVG